MSTTVLHIGPTGEQGVRGFVGNTGCTGPTGFGKTGPQGLQGVPGPRGHPWGPTGPRGSPGSFFAFSPSMQEGNVVVRSGNGSVGYAGLYTTAEGDLTANTVNATLVTAAQPYVTTLGNLATLQVDGETAVGGNMVVSGVVQRTVAVMSRRMSTTQVVSASVTLVMFDTADVFDTSSDLTGLTYSAGVFTSTATGTRVYQVSYMITYPSNSAGIRVAWISYNAEDGGSSSTTRFALSVIPAAAADLTLNGTATLVLNSGETFRIYTYQTSGSTLSISGAYSGCDTGYSTRMQAAKSMRVVLISVGVFQDYILDNVRQLKLQGNHDIVVITDAKYFDRFNQSLGVALVDAATLTSRLCDRFYQENSLDRNFRGGFWYYCSLRLFLLHAYMRDEQVTDVVHLENDNHVYVNLETIRHVLQAAGERLAATFDVPWRVIPGFVYVPNAKALEPVLDAYMMNRNDMDNMGRFGEDVIYALPIAPPDDTPHRCTQHFSTHVFDAAAIGQYLGGVDPRNMEGDTRGFINETCPIRCDNFTFLWVRGDDALWRPHLRNRSGETFPVVNLHLHCKRLSDFFSDGPRETRFIQISG